MSLGMRQAGIRILAGIDNDPACRETYKANHPRSQFINADITDFPVEDLGKKIGIGKRDDNLIFIGCSPCQHWSIITGHNDSDRKETSRKGRNLLRDFRRFVAHYLPGFVVVENVRGIDRNPGKSGLGKLRAFFKKNGYECESKVLSTNDFGVPQTRQRFILVASRVLETIPFPQPCAKKPTVRDFIGGENRLPRLKAGKCNAKDKLHKSPGLSETNLSRLRLTPMGGLRSHWHNRGDLQIDAYRDKSTSFFRENYGHMAWDKPAPTITTKFFRDWLRALCAPERTPRDFPARGGDSANFPQNLRVQDRRL